jgi:hypothetical protein
MPVIGFLSANRADANPRFTAAFREGLAAAGSVEGKDAREAADDRTEAQRWLGDPPANRSALAGYTAKLR